MHLDHLTARIGEDAGHEAHVLPRNEAELRAALLDAGALDDVLVLVVSFPAVVGRRDHLPLHVRLRREGRLGGTHLAVRLRLEAVVACGILRARLNLLGAHVALGVGTLSCRCVAAGLRGLLLARRHAFGAHLALGAGAAAAVAALGHLARGERERAFCHGDGRGHRAGTRDAVLPHRILVELSGPC